MADARAALAGEPEVLRQAAAAAIMDHGPWLLLDLAHLEGDSAAGGGEHAGGS
jgi:hypothetical protein